MAKCDCSGDDDKSEHGENVESANAEDDDAAAAAFPFLHICELLELRELWHLRGGRHKIALRLTESAFVSVKVSAGVEIQSFEQISIGGSK